MIDDNLTNTDMTYEERTNQLFAWIVEDPFYSTIHNSMVVVDDHSNMSWYYSEEENELAFEGLTDGMIRVLYKEWYKHQPQTIEQSSAPHPSTI